MKLNLRTFWQPTVLCLWLVLVAIVSTNAQVNSGSNGSDGAFNPTGNVTINMADHPTGIYHYTSVNIPSGVTVTFTPNANNTPVVWLVQGDCVIAGQLDLSGQNDFGGNGGKGGVGGYRGGTEGAAGTAAQGPGAGGITFDPTMLGAASASYASAGEVAVGSQPPAGSIYGNNFLLPLIGGSGGGSHGLGVLHGSGGGGGGGALLVASSAYIYVSGVINANGGNGGGVQFRGGGGGSGGAVRLVATRIAGSGSITCIGGGAGWIGSKAGAGRVRFDMLENNFGGSVSGILTQGFQPIIIPTSGQGVQLGIQSIGGVSVAASPSGVLANPDVILPAQQTNPMNVVVNCSNLSMNTTITVTVRPANGADIVATGTNSSGTPTASTATIPVTMPRGGGIIFAKCVSGVAGSASVSGDDYGKNIAQTGWTAHGERFAQMEITAGIGSSQQVAYITESGKRYTLPAQ